MAVSSQVLPVANASKIADLERRVAELERLPLFWSNKMHPSTFEHLKPTEVQTEQMRAVRHAAKAFGDVLEAILPDGPDKAFIIRTHRSSVMWANVAITRLPDGTPRE